MGALAAVLLPFIPGIIQGVETAFKGKPKSGDSKMQTAVRMLGQVAEGMLTAGAPLPDGTQLAPKSVSDDLLKGLIEAEFARLKATGKLDEKAPSGDVFIVRGTVVPLGGIA